MRVLFATTAGVGHLHPLVPLARAAMAAGHEVRVAAPGTLGPVLEERGLPAALLPDLSRAQAAEAATILSDAFDLPQPTRRETVLREVFGRINTTATLTAMGELVAAWQPELVVHEATEVAGVLVAQSAGIAHAGVAIGSWSLLDSALGPLAEGTAGLRDGLGLSPDPRLDAVRTAPWLTALPPGLEEPGLPGPSRTIRYQAGRIHRDTCALELPGDGPLVWATFGTVAARLPQVMPRVTSAVLEAVADLPVRCLLTLGRQPDPDEHAPLPANVTLRGYVPQEQVLPHCEAVVCHAGFNTVLAGLAHACPLLCLPLFADDQWDTAQRVADAGAGLAIADAAAQTPQAIRDALVRLLDEPGHRLAARRLADETAALASPRAAVDALVESLPAAPAADRSARR